MRSAKQGEEHGRFLSTKESLAVRFVILPRVCHKRLAKHQPTMIRQGANVETFAVSIGGDVPELLCFAGSFYSDVILRIVAHPRDNRVLLKLIPQICLHFEQNKFLLVLQVFLNIAGAIHIVIDVFPLSSCQEVWNARGINMIRLIDVVKGMLICGANHPEGDLCKEVLEDVTQQGNVTFCSARAM